MAQYPKTNLTPGMRRTSVKQLQDYLVSQGYMTQAQVNTGYGIYGPRTKAAVIKLQNALGIDNSSGPGYWGPITIGALNQSSKSSKGWTPPDVTPSWMKPKEEGVSSDSNQGWTSPDVTPSWMKPQEDISEETIPGQEYQEPQEYQKPNETFVNETREGEGTGNKTLDEILVAMQEMIDNMNDQGQIVNPNIELTPAEIQGFLDQAVTELDPYYSSYIESIKTDLADDISQLQESYNLNKEQRIADFQSSLGAQRETEATRGTIFSGGRMKRAEALKGQHERSLQALEAGTLGTARNLGTTAERDIGSTALGGVNIPQIQTGSLGFMGEGQYVPISDRSLYNLQGGVYGSKQRERKTSELLRASELEAAKRSSRALNFYN